MSEALEPDMPGIVEILEQACHDGEFGPHTQRIYHLIDDWRRLSVKTQVIIETGGGGGDGKSTQDYEDDSLIYKLVR